jgi:hypothetical protein
MGEDIERSGRSTDLSATAYRRTFADWSKQTKDSTQQESHYAKLGQEPTLYVGVHKRQ